MLEVATTLRRKLQPGPLEDAIAAGANAELDNQLVAATAAAYYLVAPRLERELQATLIACARAGARAATRAGTLRTAKEGFTIRFDVSNELAVKWAKDHAGVLITNVSAETREAIRHIIELVFRKGYSVRVAARWIRELVGLTVRDVDAVFHLRDELRGSPGQVVRAGKVRLRVPEEVTQAYIDSVAERYANKLLRARAENIARTETIAASNEGQRQLWLQGQGEGLLEPTDRRRWSAAIGSGRTCETCVELHGRLAPLDGPFEDPRGGYIMGPPAHPQCRCGTVLDFSGTEARAANYNPNQPRVPRGSPGGGQFGSYKSSAPGGGVSGTVPRRDLGDDRITVVDYGGDRMQASEARIQIRNELGENGVALIEEQAGILTEVLGDDVTIRVVVERNGVSITANSQVGKAARDFHRRYDQPQDRHDSDTPEIGAHHGLFSIKKAYQKQGRAGRMMEASLDSYEKNGVTRIDVLANIDVGGYAWAKLGFEAVDPYGFSHDAMNWLEGHLGVGTAAGKTRYTQIKNELERRGSKAPNWLANQPEGRAAMLNHSWDGFIDLKSAWGKQVRSKIVGQAKKYTPPKKETKPKAAVGVRLLAERRGKEMFIEDPDEGESPDLALWEELLDLDDIEAIKQVQTELREAILNPNQPRVPKGSPQGGQFGSVAGGGAAAVPATGPPLPGPGATKGEWKRSLKEQIAYAKQAGFTKVRAARLIGPQAAAEHIKAVAEERVRLEAEGYELPRNTKLAILAVGDQLPGENGLALRPEWAGVWTKNKTLVLNGSLGGPDSPTLVALRRQGAKTGFKSSDDRLQTPRHELAHGMHQKSAGRRYMDELGVGGPFGLEFPNQGWDHPKIRGMNSGRVKDLARIVSGYATSNPVEFVAECFAGLRAGKTYPPEVMALYEKCKGPMPKKG